MSTDAPALDAVFGALANSTRRDILSRLCRQRLTVGELAATYEVTGPAITQHLNVLERAGLIRREGRRQWRDCVVTPHGLDVAGDWITTQRDQWNERFDRLDEHLRRKRTRQ